MKTPDGVLAEIIALHSQAKSWEQIAAKINQTYGTDYTPNATRHIYRANKHLFDVSNEVASIQTLKEVARTKRDNSQKSKQNKALLEHLLNSEDMLEQIRDAVKDVNKVKVTAVKLPTKKNRTDMTIELMLTDWHIGKLTDTFNLGVARQRIQNYMQVVAGEIARKAQLYNIERFVIFLGGDLIENSLMHGSESLGGCEFQNPEQIRQSIALIFNEVMRPMSAYGLPIHLVCISGNHDRQEKDKTFNKPSKNSLCWVIYQTLKMLAEESGMKKMTWDIPEGVYAVHEIYGDPILYEHGDFLLGTTREGFIKHIAARSNQCGKLIKGLRIGHFHFDYCQDSGLVIINSSLSGQDSYSEVKGYNSRAGQTINFYVRTKNRACSFYHSFPVQLS